MILFSLPYAQALEAVLPIIQEAKQTWNVFVLNSIRSDINDQDLAKELLEANNIPYANEIETVKTEQTLSPFLRFIRKIDFQTRRLTGGIFTTAIVTYGQEKRRRMIASKWLKKLNPDVLITAGDQTLLQKHLVEVINNKRIPTINFQWTIANASQKHTAEITSRFDNVVKQQPLSVRINRQIKEIFTSLFLRLSGLHIKFNSDVFGGGNAKKFAVIGQGCFDNYVSMGIPAETMIITGHPTYENLHKNADKLIRDMVSRKEIFEVLNIPNNQKLILWCTNDQRTYFEGIHTYEEMYESWETKVKILLELEGKYEIVIKIHPKEKLNDYRQLERLSPRVHVINKYDVLKLIPHSELVITRFSSTAVSALCLKKPVITHNYPSIPGGTLFEDIGGTIHVNSDAEFKSEIDGILTSGSSSDKINMRREEFLSYYLDLGNKSAIGKFMDIINQNINN